tara:strand:+ start:686 stop:877 length:192 start_codon:yes stop_codon:yes gene_type:complete
MTNDDIANLIKRAEKYAYTLGLAVGGISSIIENDNQIYSKQSLRELYISLCVNVDEMESKKYG